ncbi:HtaA domain-containing protein [Cellulomonas sp. GbtcB1]|uniref:HtaA domain-containing protein n=1 Tax=Cellulomonas sp. GbtcB1 TaxID=2824746 RepID=UPI001C304AA4|nr:HtaA domain-containing protein [Cellulomonas sp. GbtcB1]
MHRGTRTRAWRAVTGALVALVVGAGSALVATPAVAAPTPTLTVSPTTGLDPEGATITITGRDFDPAFTQGPMVAGMYAQIGWLADTWRPSQGAAAGARSNAYRVAVEDTPTGGEYVQWTDDDGDGLVDFTWTQTITKAALDAVEIEGGQLAVFTVGGKGVVQAGNEVAVPIAFAEPVTEEPGTGEPGTEEPGTGEPGTEEPGTGEPGTEEPGTEEPTAPAEPTLTVTPTTGLDPEGATLTITGSGYDTSALGLYGPNAGQPAGFYAQVGWLASTWRPSEGAATSARTNAYSAWVQGVSETSPYLKWTLAADGTAGFTWTVMVDKETLDAKALAGGTLAVFTTGAGGTTQAGNERAVPIAFAAAGGETPGGENPGGGEGGETPGTPGTPGGGTPAPSCVAITGATFSWGVRESFRSYITSPIASGSISTTGVTGTGPWTWSAGTGQVDADGLATSTWSGGVRFTGHEGALDLTFASPEVRVTGATTASLLMSVSSGTAAATRVEVATLDLAGGTAGSTASKVAWSGVPATLTAAGSTAFAGFYPAGAPLDPVSFTLPLGAATDCGTPTVPSTPTVPTTPTLPGGDAEPAPVREVQGLSASGAVTAGGELTLTANGFGAGEGGIRLELHSDPVLLATLTADASGTVAATFTIPASTPAGAHTLVLIGAGQTLEFPITVQAAAPTCVARAVSGASFTWGVRDSFRSYVTGPIASGSISASGVSGSGPWTWSGGTGRYNTAGDVGSASWSGGVQFTGHAGQLDLTFSNPTVRVTSGSSATLTMTVASPSGSSRVALATLDLSAGSASSGASQVAWSGIPATLTQAGATVFQGFYSAGAALDPVSFTLPLGAEVECDVASGSLATTGAEPGDAVGYAVALLLFGALLTAAAYRRRQRSAALAA